MKISKVLFVEDYEYIRDMAKVYFAHMLPGTELLFAPSVPEARIQLSKHNFNLVISDFELETSETGAELLREVKTKNPDMTCWLMSGNPDKVPKEDIAWEVFFPKEGNFILKMIENIQHM